MHGGPAMEIRLLFRYIVRCISNATALRGNGMEKSRIMIVEDESLVALAIEKSLKNMGYEVPVTVSTGEEAVRKAMEVEPDLILMDIRLKGVIDGVEAAGMIREAFRVPIVYLTAYSEEKTLERAKLTEPFGYITKPFEERTLQATVEMALYKSTMEGKLWRAKEKLQTILRSIGEGVVVADTKGVVEYLNPTAQRTLLGSEHAGSGVCLGQILMVFDAETLEKVVVPLARVVKSGEIAEMTDLILLTRDRGRIRVDCTLAPYRDENGNVRGVVLAFRDVTERTKFRDIVSRELAQALELQRNLLPREDVEIPGLRVQWLFHPSDLAAGDLFNAFPVDSRHVCLYMIDVAGHGLASAVNSLLLHRLIFPSPYSPHGRLPLLDADPLSPRDVMEKLNEKFVPASGIPYFSILYGIIDTTDWKVTIARAGQPYPVWQKGDGGLHILRVPGRALGLAPELELAESELALEPGDRLFFYSDGLIDCGNPDMVKFSEDRVMALIRKTRSANLQDAVAAIDAQLLQWRVSRDFEDDICLIAFERE
jgi:PAS domain S-box-containing protein